MGSRDGETTAGSWVGATAGTAAEAVDFNTVDCTSYCLRAILESSKNSSAIRQTASAQEEDNLHW
jgi:hypothetical protein